MRGPALFLLVSAAAAWSNGILAGGMSPDGPVLLVTSADGSRAPYEPVVVQYALTNRSERPITVSGLVGTAADAITWEVTNQDGKFRPYRTGSIACGAAPDHVLAPGASLHGQVMMISNQFADPASMVARPEERTPPHPFAQPGNYEVRATYLLPRRSANEARTTVVSEASAIVVRVPTPRETEAMAFFETPTDLVVALGGERVGEAATQADRSDMVTVTSRWEQFVDRFGDTAYSPFVRLNLARTYRADPRLQVARPDLALTHLREVVKSGPRVINDDALLELAKAAVEANRTDEAAEAVAQLLRGFPESELVREAERIRDGLKAGRRTLKEIFGN